MTKFDDILANWKSAYCQAFKGRPDNPSATLSNIKEKGLPVMASQTYDTFLKDRQNRGHEFRIRAYQSIIDDM